MQAQEAQAPVRTQARISEQSESRREHAQDVRPQAAERPPGQLQTHEWPQTRASKAARRRGRRRIAREEQRAPSWAQWKQDPAAWQ